MALLELLRKAEVDQDVDFLREGVRGGERWDATRSRGAVRMPRGSTSVRLQVSVVPHHADPRCNVLEARNASGAVSKDVSHSVRPRPSTADNVGRER